MNKPKEIIINGTGLVGTLMAIYLAKRGYSITLLDKRKDPRIQEADDNRSINLALSHRGIRALAEVGLADFIHRQAIPMKGRYVHAQDGRVSFYPYGKEGQMIYSISRHGLNKLLVEKAGEFSNIQLYFNQLCEKADTNLAEVLAVDTHTQENRRYKGDMLIGADGVFSVVRKQYIHTEDVLEELSHSYKELNMPSINGRHAMSHEGLHIWPRGKFMLIALPNPDGTFTCTLFLPTSGEYAFDRLVSPDQVLSFFHSYFPDAVGKMPGLTQDFFSNPCSKLFTLHTYPWVYQHSFLIGDAAHAIVPFYGQGMNAGFEDTRVLNNLLDRYQDDWEKALPEYQVQRKEDGEAIASLALHNFIEMRDLVAQPRFVLQKKIETKIHHIYPDYLPLYTMVTFSDIRYSEALQKGNIHQKMMDEVLDIPDIADIWDNQEAWEMITEILKAYGIR